VNVPRGFRLLLWVLVALFLVSLLLRIGMSPAAELGASASSSRAPTLPSNPEIKRIGPASLLDRGRTLLGASELVAFPSRYGLCVEVTHLPERTRAGGCQFASLFFAGKVAIFGQGYSATAGPQGITEVFGHVAPGVRAVRVEFRQGTAWRRQPVLVGALPPSPSSAGDEGYVGSWFASDLPGCLQASRLRVRVYGNRGGYLGQIPGLKQRAACKLGSGYSIRGAVSYGSLPIE
jgi:hypothetical protein